MKFRNTVAAFGAALALTPAVKAAGECPVPVRVTANNVVLATDPGCAISQSPFLPYLPGSAPLSGQCYSIRSGANGTLRNGTTSVPFSLSGSAGITSITPGHGTTQQGYPAVTMEATSDLKAFFNKGSAERNITLRFGTSDMTVTGLAPAGTFDVQATEQLNMLPGSTMAINGTVTPNPVISGRIGYQKGVVINPSNGGATMSGTICMSAKAWSAIKAP